MMNNLHNDLPDEYFDPEAESKESIFETINKIKLLLESIEPKLGVFSSPVQKSFVKQAIEYVEISIITLEGSVDCL